MTRHEFQPARDLNVLAAAWIQFENHNWFFHGRGKAEEIMEVPLEPTATTGTRTRCTSAAPSRVAGRQRTTGNTETHWWDGVAALRLERGEAERRCARFKDGKLKIGDDGRLLPDPDEPALDLTGFNENFWFGLSCLHTLFTKEHNAICDVLKRENPGWDDQRLFDTAWLINAALMAKIHTVEWTPGIVNTPALWVAMNTNWSGVLGQHIKDRFGRLGDSELFSGIMGSPQEHHGARFQLTEEFVSVYRMHPLIRDDWNFFSHEDGRKLGDRAVLDDLHSRKMRPFMDNYEIPDLIYSMGVEHPGKITLHNYPRALQRHTRIDGEIMDLRDARRPARPRARRPALQRLPRGDADAARALVRGAHRQPAVGGGDPPRLQQRHRQGRPAGRHVRRAARRRASASPTPRSASSS